MKRRSRRWSTRLVRPRVNGGPTLGTHRQRADHLDALRSHRRVPPCRVDVAPTPRCAMTVAYISHSDCGRHDTGWGHPEHVGRLRAIPRALREDADLFHALAAPRGQARDAGRVRRSRTIVRVHRRECGRSRSRRGRLDPDTVISEGSWDAATAAAGCVLDARGHGVRWSCGARASARCGRQATTR